jgi:hypothetical protein
VSAKQQVDRSNVKQEEGELFALIFFHGFKATQGDGIRHYDHRANERRSKNWDIKHRIDGEELKRDDDAIYNTFNGISLIFSYGEIKLMDGRARG